MKPNKVNTILFFSAHTDKWGAERSTCSLAAYLQSMGYNVLFIIPNDGPIIELLQDYSLEYEILAFNTWIRTNNILKSLVKGLFYRFYNLLLALKLIFILKSKRINPIIVYSNTIVFGMGILVSLIYRIPHVQHIRENVYTFGMKFFFGYSMTFKIVSLFSKLVICTCRSIMNVYVPYMKKGNITYEYNGVPIINNSHKKDDALSIKDIMFFIVVARLNEDKRVMDIAEAVKKLVDKGITNFRIDVYGEGPQREEIEKYLSMHNIENYMSLMGFQKNIDFGIYSVGILASTFEAFARSVLEYMMNDLAVIGSNSGGTKEQIIDKETGLLFEPHNYNQLADKMEYMIKHPEECRVMGLNGRKKVESDFSQDRYVKGVSKLILEQLKIK